MTEILDLSCSNLVTRTERLYLLEGGNYSFKWSYELSSDINAWLQEQKIANTFNISMGCLELSPDDAMLFKLKWGC